MQAVESLMPLEKNCRVNHDAASLSRVLIAVVEILYNKKAWKDLNEYIGALTKVLTDLGIFQQRPENSSLRFEFFGTLDHESGQEKSL